MSEGAAAALSRLPDRSADFEFPIERGKILELARALRASDPAFHGRHPIAPPTILMSAGAWGYSWEHPGDSAMADVDVDPARILHLSETHEYLGPPLQAGDVLHGSLRLTAAVEKVGRRSGPMTIYTTETAFAHPDGAPAATAVQVIAHLHEPSHAEPAPVAATRTDLSGLVPDGAPWRLDGPLTMEDVVQYQAASGDLNPHHYDPEVLARSGSSRFFSPGMLQAGYLGVLLAETYGPTRIRAVEVGFHELVYVGDHVLCYLVPKREGDGELEVELFCLRGDGALAVSGTGRVRAS